MFMFMFLEIFSVNNFALSDEEDNTPRPLNRGSMADLLRHYLQFIKCPESKVAMITSLSEL